MEYINHYSLDFNQVSHRGINIVDTTTSESYHSNVINLDKLPYDKGTIPPGYEHRPDLISDLFYGSVKLDWLLLLFNNIDDPFQQLNIGDTILIPKVF